MTRDEFIDALANDLTECLPSNVNLTGSNIAIALNSVINTCSTVDPTKKPTIKHITDIEFN
jgi:hypothetical protein